MEKEKRLEIIKKPSLRIVVKLTTPTLKQNNHIIQQQVSTINEK